MSSSLFVKLSPLSLITSRRDAGTGEGDSAWPAIEPSTFIEPSEPSHSFAPSSLSFNPRLASKGLKNLHLHGPGWRRRNYLFELFSKLADARLSRSENARFLERFRYIIVASQLLSEHINFSHYNHNNRSSGGNFLPPQFAEGDSDSTAFFGPRFAKARHWAGNGLCMSIVTILLGWVLKLGDRQKGHLSQGRAGLGLLGLTLVGVIFFTNARRRWLRTLRGRTIELATQFVENSQAYDILASNAITFIQEVELVSRGYRLSTPLPPISRLDRDSHMRRCARLRRSVLASLNLAMTPYSQAFQILRPLTQESDLDKYYDIYDVRNADIEYLTLAGGCIREDEFEDLESLKALKALLHRLHTTRKVFLCCLLALDANGGYSDFSTWRTVVEQLKVLSTLMGEIAESLQQCSEEESQFHCPPTPSSTRPTTSHATSPTRERWRGQVRKLNSLSQALRGLQAKMQILREESDKSLQDESMDLVEFGPDLLAHYDSIGSDLQALMQEWESGRTLLVMSIDKQGGNSNRSSLISPLITTGNGPSWSQTQSLDGATPRNSWGVLSPTGEGTEAVARLREKMGELVEGDEGVEVDDGKTEMIYEGVGDVGKPRPRSNLTREERIRRVQEERTRLIEERKKLEQKGNLVKELQSVLVNRPSIPQRRVPVRSVSS